MIKNCGWMEEGYRAVKVISRIAFSFQKVKDQNIEAITNPSYLNKIIQD
jgi:hypothetical protein